MKASLFVLFILFSVLSVKAQKKEITVFCTIDFAGRAQYGDLGKLLPDSLKSTLLIDPRKQVNLRNPLHVVLWMNENGWKLVTVISNVTSGGMVTTEYGYFMSKQIYLDDAAAALFHQNLINSEKIGRG